MTSRQDDKLQRNFARARETIDAAARRSGRTGADVTVLAAVKYVDADIARALVSAGVRDLAENRLAHMRERQVAFDAAPATTTAGEAPRFHFIGRLQSREAAEVAARCGPDGLVHTLCSDSAVRRLAAAGDACSVVPLPELLVQVNVDGDPGKDGLQPDEVDDFLERLPDPLRVAGLMTMPAFADDAELSRPAFAALRELCERLAPLHVGRHDLRLLSMGTSQDCEVAVEEGATHVRLGRILYA